MDVKQDADQVENGEAQGPKKKKITSGNFRIVILIVIVLAAAGLYILKNPIGARTDDTSATTGAGQHQTAEFDLDATQSFDLDAILSHNLPVIIDFGADTCIPCKEMAPILLELNQELRGKAVVKFVDVWKNSAAGQEVPLEVIPTQFFFNADGSPYVPADENAAAANGFILYTLKDTGKHVYTAHQGGLDKETILAVLTEMGMK